MRERSRSRRLRPGRLRPAHSQGAAVRSRLARPRSLEGKGIHVTLLAAVWVLLWGRVSLVSVGSGLLVAVLITLAFPMPAIAWPGRLHPWGLVRLLAVLIWDLARASLHLAAFALAWRRQPRSGIVAVRLHADADLYQVATSTILSIVPGSLVIEARARSRTIYLHVFDMNALDAGRERLAALAAEVRVLRAFGTRQELEAAQASYAREVASWERETAATAAQHGDTEASYATNEGGEER